eukprot:GEMP01000637.1.p1 GENE.GEMP01000637.1~~GEMP01000637.1.p1  ORF type:complete len:1799 (+),score=442.43 GEMP01000637.1:184-5580(+)
MDSPIISEDFSQFSAPISENFNSCAASVHSDFPPSSHHTYVASPLRSPAQSVASSLARHNTNNSTTPALSEIHQAPSSYGSDFESAPASVRAVTARKKLRALPLQSQTKSYGSDFESDDGVEEKTTPGARSGSGAAAMKSGNASAVSSGNLMSGNISMTSSRDAKRTHKSPNSSAHLSPAVSSSSAHRSGARAVAGVCDGSGGNAPAPRVSEATSSSARSNGAQVSGMKTGAVNSVPSSTPAMRDSRSLAASLRDRPSTGSVNSVIPCSTAAVRNQTSTSSSLHGVYTSGITTGTINTVPYNSPSDGYAASSSHPSVRSSHNLRSGTTSSSYPTPAANTPGSSMTALYRRPSSTNSIRSIGSSDVSPIYSSRSGSTKTAKTSDGGAGVGNVLFPLLEDTEAEPEHVYLNPCGGDLPMSTAVLTQTARMWQLVFEKLHERKIVAVTAEDYIEAQESVEAAQTLKEAKQRFTGRHGAIAGKWSWLRHEFRMALESEEFSYCCDLKELRGRILEEFNFLKNEEQEYLANLMRTDIRHPPRPTSTTSGSPCSTTSSAAPTPRPQKGNRTKPPLADNAPYYAPFDTSLPQNRGASPYFSMNYKVTPRTSRATALQKAAFRFAANAAVQGHAKTKNARSVILQCAEMNKKCTDAVEKLEQWQTRVDERLDDLLVATLSPQRTKKLGQTKHGEQDQQQSQWDNGNVKDLAMERGEERVGTGVSNVHEAQQPVVLPDTRQRSAVPIAERTAADNGCVASKPESKPRIFDSKPKVAASVVPPKLAFADTKAAKAVSSKQEPTSQPPQHPTAGPRIADTNAVKAVSSKQGPTSQPPQRSTAGASNVIIERKGPPKRAPHATVSRPIIPPAIEWSSRFDRQPKVPQLSGSSPPRSLPLHERKQPPIIHSSKQLSPHSVGTSAYDYSADIAKFKPKNSISAAVSKATSTKAAPTVAPLPPVAAAVPAPLVTAEVLKAPLVAEIAATPSASSSRPPTPRRDEWDKDFVVNPMASDAGTLMQSLKASGIWICLWHNSTKSPETILERPPPRFVVNCLRALGAPPHDIDQYDASGRERFFHGVLQCTSLGVNLMERKPLLFPKPDDITKGLQSAKCRRVLQSILHISKMSTELPTAAQWENRFPSVDSKKLSFDKVVEHMLEVNNSSAEFLDGVRQILHVGGWVNYVRGLLWFRSEADASFEFDPSLLVATSSRAALEDTFATAASAQAWPADGTVAANATDDTVSSSVIVEAGDAAENAIAETEIGQTTLSEASSGGARAEKMLPPVAEEAEEESTGAQDVIMEDTTGVTVTVKAAEVSVMIETSAMAEVLLCGEELMQAEEDYEKADSEILSRDGDAGGGIDDISGEDSGGIKDITKDEEREKSVDANYDVADKASGGTKDITKEEEKISVGDNYDLAFEIASELTDNAASADAEHTIDDASGKGSGGTRDIAKNGQEELLDENYDAAFEGASEMTGDSITAALNDLPREKSASGSDSQVAEVLSDHTAGKPSNFDYEESIQSLVDAAQQHVDAAAKGTTTPNINESLVGSNDESVDIALTEENLRADDEPIPSHSLIRPDDSEVIMGKSPTFEEESVQSVETPELCDVLKVAILEDDASDGQDSILDVSDYEGVARQAVGERVVDIKNLGLSAVSDEIDIDYGDEEFETSSFAADFSRAENFRERFGASDEVASGSAKKQRPLSAMGGRKPVGDMASIGFSNVPAKSPFLEVDSRLPDDDRRGEKKKKKEKKEKKNRMEHVSSSNLYRPSNALQPLGSASHARHVTTPSAMLKPLESKHKKKKKNKEGLY